MVTISPAYWPISQLPGLKGTDVLGLRQVGIETTEDLLNVGPLGNPRQQLAAQLNHKVELVNRWMAMADLARIPSVGCTYCGLLLHSGIVSAQQLAASQVPWLHHQVRRMHVSTLSQARGCPSMSDVARWIAQAKQIPAIAG